MNNSEGNRDDRQKPVDPAADSDASLQDELQREMKEGERVIGDMAQNRNVSGSSTWETLPESSEPKE